MRITTEEFIRRARKVHGDKYDYSKAEYVNPKTKVCIACKIHGIFWQRAWSHLEGRGCPECGKAEHTSVTEFVKRARKIHGDKYDYSLVDFTSLKNKVRIICPRHGVFLQTGENHLSGRGCIKCSYEQRGNRCRSSLDTFIEKARKIHGDSYDYSKVHYVNNRTNVCIICKEHGEFFMTPSNHLKGQKCPVCQRINVANFHRSNKEEFEMKARMIYGDKYDYSKVVYINNLTPVEIICPEHGSFFQLPSNHLKGEECMVCGIRRRSEKSTNTTDDFIRAARKVHGDRYDYSLVSYTKSSEKVRIVCKKHGVFEQIANNHLKGKGCPHCQTSHGENKVKAVLDEMGVSYIQQHWFRNESIFCRNKKLKVDFYIPSLNTIIEYNGEQHYIEKPIWGGAEELTRIQERDQSLRMFCKEHKINLIEIPYTEKNNINSFLRKRLKGKRT